MSDQAHKVFILGNGSFATCLRNVLPKQFEVLPGYEINDLPLHEAVSVIMAVPVRAIPEIMQWKGIDHHFVNVCSSQTPAISEMFRACGMWSGTCTSVHPLWGARTPENERYHILTHLGSNPLAEDFMRRFNLISNLSGTMTPEEHDLIMAKTHLVALMAAKQLKVLVDQAAGIPENQVPNSFKLLRKFVKTMEDMPPGTVETIMANPYA